MHGSVAAAINAAKVAGLDALIERCPGRIIIGGTAYAGAVNMDNEGFTFGPGGVPETTHSTTVILRKCDYPGPPERGKVITVDSVAFLIEEISGQLERDIHWKMRCRRAPGEDDET
jgi:hypothetical protein